MQAARAWSVPFRRFNGFEPEETVVEVLERDRSGRVVKKVTTRTREQEWSDEDRAWAEALLLVEDRQCGGCGRPASEAYNDEAAYEVQHHWCQACLQGGLYADKVSKDRPKAPHHALKIVATPR